MPAVIIFLVGLVLVAFLIAFGANKLLEASGIDIAVPGGYILPTILVIVLLYLPFAVSAQVQFRRARDRDPDSLLAQDTRTLNQMARRNEAAARALHQVADQVDSASEPMALPYLEPTGRTSEHTVGRPARLFRRTG